MHLFHREAERPVGRPPRRVLGAGLDQHAATDVEQGAGDHRERDRGAAVQRAGDGRDGDRHADRMPPHTINDASRMRAVKPRIE